LVKIDIICDLMFEPIVVCHV